VTGRVRPVLWASLGFVAGAALGLAAWTTYQDRHAQSLFSPKVRRRWAALGRLASDAGRDSSMDTVGLLREYVAWERNPRLQRRGRAILSRLVSTLD
jgi:hypothetical protein